MNSVLAETIETLDSGEGLLSFLEYLATHVYEVDFVGGVGV
jgi:hypothetical protein